VRARGRQLHHPELRTAGVVGIQPPPELLIEALGLIDVGDGHHDDLKFHIHDFGSFC
jgi:hypothetical protein